MARKLSYEDIVRRTVPEPDSSFRPTTEQIAEAGEESRAKRLQAQMTDAERAVHAQVAQTLGALAELGDIGFELDGRTLTLSGTVHDVTSIHEIERAVAELGGIDEIHNRLVVAARQ